MSSDIITIRKSPSADTRTAQGEVSKETLLESSKMHISDVQKGMKWCAKRLLEAGTRHDWTKIEYIDEFYKQFNNAMKTGDWGKGWYDEIHIVKERHHLKDNPPEDVDLLDVIEQVVDGVMAGLARSGKYREEPPSPELLVKAYNNFCKRLAGSVRVGE